MDTTKLVVGQEVWMFNGVKIRGISFFNGKVIKVTPDSTHVEATDPFGGGHNLIWRFDTQGESNDHRVTGGPWFIDTLPFEVRKVEIEESNRREERRLELWNEIYSTLVVGQEVFVASGCGGFYANGKVVTVTQEGVEVQMARDKAIWRFDTKGVGTADYGLFIYAEGGTFIDDMPFEERKAELLEAQRRRERLQKQYPDGSVIPANEPLPPIFDGPFWL
jgi:preprotein translocase subunit YajC